MTPTGKKTEIIPKRKERLVVFHVLTAVYQKHGVTNESINTFGYKGFANKKGRDKSQKRRSSFENSSPDSGAGLTTRTTNTYKEVNIG